MCSINSKQYITRMHSNRMRTARSLPYGGGSLDRDSTLDRDPLDRAPPGQRPPQQRRIPPWKDKNTCGNITLPLTSFAGGKNDSYLYQIYSAPLKSLRVFLQHYITTGSTSTEHFDKDMCICSCILYVSSVQCNLVWHH